jgi:hypothetical protein
MPLLMGCDNLETKSVVRRCDLRNRPCTQMKFRGDLFSQDAVFRSDVVIILRKVILSCLQVLHLTVKSPSLRPRGFPPSRLTTAT